MSDQSMHNASSPGGSFEDLTGQAMPNMGGLRVRILNPEIFQNPKRPGEEIMGLAFFPFDKTSVDLKVRQVVYNEKNKVEEIDVLPGMIQKTGFSYLEENGKIMKREVETKAVEFEFIYNATMAPGFIFVPRDIVRIFMDDGDTGDLFLTGMQIDFGKRASIKGNYFTLNVEPFYDNVQPKEPLFYPGVPCPPFWRPHLEAYLEQTM